MCHDAFICHMNHQYLPCLFYTWNDITMCDVTHPYVLVFPMRDIFVRMCHDSFICPMTRAYVPPRCYSQYLWLSHGTYDILINESWYTRAMTHLYVPWLVHMSLHTSHTCAMTHSFVCRMCHDSFICPMTHPHVTRRIRSLFSQCCHACRPKRSNSTAKLSNSRRQLIQLEIWRFVTTAVRVPHGMTFRI